MNQNIDLVKEMIAEGHTLEAAEWAKLMANVLPENEARALLLVLADAILNPVPRRRGDKFAGGRKFEKFVGELVLSNAISDSGKTRTAAFDLVGAKHNKSGGTAKRLYYKHKTESSK